MSAGAYKVAFSPRRVFANDDGVVEPLPLVMTMVAAAAETEVGTSSTATVHRPAGRRDLHGLLHGQGHEVHA